MICFFQLQDSINQIEEINIQKSFWKYRLASVGATQKKISSPNCWKLSISFAASFSQELNPHHFYHGFLFVALRTSRRCWICQYLWMNAARNSQNHQDNSCGPFSCALTIKRTYFETKPDWNPTTNHCATNFWFDLQPLALKKHLKARSEATLFNKMI